MEQRIKKEKQNKKRINARNKLLKKEEQRMKKKMNKQ